MGDNNYADVADTCIKPPMDGSREALESSAHRVRNQLHERSNWFSPDRRLLQILMYSVDELNISKIDSGAPRATSPTTDIPMRSLQMTTRMAHLVAPEPAAEN